MTITSARLQNFRSYDDSSFEFEPHVNIVVGPNAIGKTNLLDAVHMAATGASIRLTKGQIIRHGSEWARIDTLTSSNQERIVKILPDASRPEVIIDDKPYKRLPLDQKLPLVLFEPNQLHFITTSPEMRRQFLDEILEKTDPNFSRLRSSYTRTLRQRNSLLKLPLNQVKEQIFAWDVRLCEQAGQYVQKRKDLIARLCSDLSETYSSIAGVEHTIDLQYEPKGLTGASYTTELLQNLQKKLELDHLRGFTGFGPHRDDMGITIDDLDMRDVASRGETRSILLALKIAESHLLEEVRAQKPLLLLDDVFGELDGVRRKSLIGFIKDNQTFITTTDADIVSHTFAQSANIIMVRK